MNDDRDQVAGILERIVGEVREFGVTDNAWSIKVHSDAVQMFSGKRYGRTTYELKVTVDHRNLDELERARQETGKSSFIQAMALEAEKLRRTDV